VVEVVEESSDGCGTGGNGGSGIVVVKESYKCASGVWSMQSVYCEVSNDNWITRTAAIDYMVVAGGGGGGAGRVVVVEQEVIELLVMDQVHYKDHQSLSLGTYAVTVGAGGAGGTVVPMMLSGATKGVQ
jgi:hypothetical protein